MLKVNSLAILFFILFISSCTITNEIHFNQDFSGTFRIDINMTEFKNKMSKTDSTGQKFNAWRDSIKRELERIDTFGIHNIQLGWLEESKTFFYSFDFKNLESLNTLYRGLISYNSRRDNIPFDSTFVYFYKKGKDKLVFASPEQSNSVKQNEALSESFKDSFKYKYIFSFESEIKSIDYPGFKISNNRKKAGIEGSMYDKNLPYNNNKIIFKLK